VRLGSSQGWRVDATLSRDDFDAIGRRQPVIGVDCSPSASYCNAAQGEFFRGLQVNGDSAIVIHLLGPLGESNLWSVAWFDDGADATYYLGAGVAITNADTTAFPKGKSPSHLTAGAASCRCGSEAGSLGA